MQMELVTPYNKFISRAIELPTNIPFLYVFCSKKERICKLSSLKQEVKEHGVYLKIEASFQSLLPNL